MNVSRYMWTKSNLTKFFKQTSLLSMVPSEAQKFNETSSGTDPIIKKTADANTRYKPISLSITSPKVQGFLGAI